MGKKRKRALKHFLIAVAIFSVFLVIFNLVIPKNNVMLNFSPELVQIAMVEFILRHLEVLVQIIIIMKV